jgi:hypothetical protein
VKRRSPSDRPRSKAGTSRKKLDCLDVLTGDEASAVLSELLRSHPNLLPDATRAANALLATVSFTNVAKTVFDALLALDLDDLDAGSRAGGYVEPSEAAWAAIENVVAPYFHDLERRVKLRHEDEAIELCKGIVLGLYRAEHRGFSSSICRRLPVGTCRPRRGYLATPAPQALTASANAIRSLRDGMLSTGGPVSHNVGQRLATTRSSR